MNRLRARRSGTISLRLLVLLLLAGLLPTGAAADENDLLAYCLANSDACAISVQAVDAGWEGHWNADRPQVLASTFKIAVLLAYAQAVADGAVSPDDTIDKDDWGRYDSGGTTLSTSWNYLGNPDNPRLDDLAHVMILHSNNAAPDFFLATLKKKLIKNAVKRFDWHNFPAGISSIFGLWQNLNGIGGTGNRIAADYGGFEAAGYQKELSKLAKALKSNAFVADYRRSLCQQPPWISGTPPCNRPQPSTTNESYEILENHHFNRSTTRSYASLMRKLLDRTLLSAAAQEVVERHLEGGWFELFPTLSPTFSRYGIKGGNLATGDGNQILTWAHYMQTSAGRFVVVVFLQDMLSTRNVPEVADVNAFAQQFALNAGFRQQVRNAIGDATLPTELAPQLKKLKLKNGKSLTIKAKVFNTSPVDSGRAIDVSLYILDETDPKGASAVKTARVGNIAGFKSKTATLKFNADENISGKFAVVLVDSDRDVAEQDEDNNLTWQRLD